MVISLYQFNSKKCCCSAIGQDYDISNMDKIMIGREQTLQNNDGQRTDITK